MKKRYGNASVYVAIRLCKTLTPRMRIFPRQSRRPDSGRRLCRAWACHLLNAAEDSGYDRPSSCGRNVESRGKSTMTTRASNAAKISGRAGLLICSMLRPLMLAPT